MNSNDAIRTPGHGEARSRSESPFWKRLFVESRWRWPTTIALASAIVVSVMLGVDVVSGAMKGWMRWRLEDGSLLTVSTGVAWHEARLSGPRGVTTVRFEASRDIASAECRTDGGGNYWIVTRDGTSASVPVFVSASAHSLYAPGFGPGRAPTKFSPDSGELVRPAWFSLLSR